MKLGLRYETAYRYEEPVAFSPHEVRLFPRTDRYHFVRRLSFTAHGNATVRYARDVFDNVFASCIYHEKMRELSYALEIDLDLETKDAFDFILEPGAVDSAFYLRTASRDRVAALPAPADGRRARDSWVDETDSQRAAGNGEHAGGTKPGAA